MRSQALPKNIVKIVREKPDHFHGTKHEWKLLIKSLLIPPDNDFIWLQDKETGAWSRSRIG